MTAGAPPQALNATSGFVCIVTNAACRLVYKDCAGITVDTGALTSVVGNTIEIPAAATELTTNTGLLVIAYWHPSTAR